MDVQSIFGLILPGKKVALISHNEVFHELFLAHVVPPGEMNFANSSSQIIKVCIYSQDMKIIHILTNLCVFSSALVRICFEEMPSL